MTSVNTAVLWVYQEVRDKKGVPLESGQKPSLCFRGQKHMLCIAAGHPVRVLKRSAKDFDKLRRVTQNGEEYPVEKAIQSLSEIAGRNGVTEQAKRLLELDMSDTAFEFEDYVDEEQVSNLVQPTKEDEDNAELDSENAARKRSGGSSVLAKVCEDLKIDPALARRTLRKKGLSRPYDDEALLRQVLG
jgi:hypothetical protein